MFKLSILGFISLKVNIGSDKKDDKKMKEMYRLTMLGKAALMNKCRDYYIAG